MRRPPVIYRPDPAPEEEDHAFSAVSVTVVTINRCGTQRAHRGRPSYIRGNVLLDCSGRTQPGYVLSEAAEHLRSHPQNILTCAHCFAL